MQNSKGKIVSMAVVGLVTVMAPVFAATTTGSRVHSAVTSASATSSKATADKSTLDHSDKKFVTDAAEGGMMEVELGKLAAEKGADSDVKAFGQRMVDDHTKANDKLKTIAASKGVTLPTDLGPMDKHMRDKLQKASGAEFDRLYISHMVKDHEKDVKDFAHASKAAKDADVKSFASDTLPTLQEHLKLAQSAAEKIGASTKHTTSKKKS